jgi:hypothetical protein
MGTAGSFLNQVFFGVVVFINRIKSFFQHSQNLHHARFAQLPELTGLLTDRFDETSLLLGVSSFNRQLHVRPHRHGRNWVMFLLSRQHGAGRGYSQHPSCFPGRIP